MQKNQTRNMNTMMHDPSQRSYGVNNNIINNDVDVDSIVTIEEPDDTSDLMLHLEDAVRYASLPTSTVAPAAPSAPSAAHDLFYHHFDYDPLLYVAEYNTNNPILDNDNDNDKIDIIIHSEEQQRIRQGSFEKKKKNTSFHYSLEPISESDEEIDEVIEEEEERYNHV